MLPPHAPSLARALLGALSLAACDPYAAEPVAPSPTGADALTSEVHGVAGGCLPGAISICEDPVTGASPGAHVDGGTLLPTGYRIDDRGNHVTFDLGEDVVEGTIRFTLGGIGPASLQQDTLLLLLATDTPELTNPAPTRVLELKIWGGSVDPAAEGNTRLGVGCSAGACPGSATAEEATKSAGVLAYDIEHTYEFVVAWDEAAQSLMLERDGETLVDFVVGGANPGPEHVPIPMHYRYIHLAMPHLNSPAFWPIIDGVYGSVSIGATPAAGVGDDGTGSDGGGVASGDDGEPAGSSDGDAPGAESSSSSSSSESGEVEDIDASEDEGSSGGDTAPLPLPLDGDRGSAEGCACTAAGPRTSGWMLALVVAIVAARRRRHALS